MIGQVFRSWREHNRYGQTEAAKLIGVSKATLSRVERGERMDQRTMMLLINWLFGADR